jgi:hypothetical protein
MWTDRQREGKDTDIETDRQTETETDRDRGDELAVAFPNFVKIPKKSVMMLPKPGFIMVQYRCKSLSQNTQTRSNCTAARQTMSVTLQYCLAVTSDCAQRAENCYTATDGTTPRSAVLSSALKKKTIQLAWGTRWRSW